MAKSMTAAPKPTIKLEEPAPLHKPHPQLTPQSLAEANAKHDRVLAALIVVLAFLLASFPIMNSDLWLHLRTGQLIANGHWPFTEEPFSYTTPEGTTWVHPAWLFDLLLYGVYAFTGSFATEANHNPVFGAILVLLRGLLVAGLSLVMLRIRRLGASLFISALGVGLAVIVLSPRLLLRSELVSFLFLGLTLFLLWRTPIQAQSRFVQRLVGLTQNRLWVFLPPLFVLWANLDHLFFLGPLTVALFLFAEVLQDVFSANRFREGALTPAERANLFLVLVAGLAACLLNPFHVRVFQLPAEWGAEALQTLQANEGPSRLAHSPFGAAHFRRTPEEQQAYRPLGLALAEWCYYPLVALGVISFVLNRKSTRLWRAFVWIAFFLLSTWQVRNVGLFAVIAGPITALNLQDWLTLRSQAATFVTRRGVLAGQLGRMLTFAIVIFLAALTLGRFPGQSAYGFVHGRGELGWSLVEDPSLREVADRLAQWRREGKLTGWGFNFDWNNQPDYLAWFGPENKNFLDSRFALHSAAVKDYVDLRLALRDTGTRQAAPHRWQDVFNRYGISHIVVRAHDSAIRINRAGNQVAVPLVDVLLRDNEKNWEQLDYHDGRIYILGWKKSPHWANLKKLRFEPEREAFREPRYPPPASGPDYSVPAGLPSWLTGRNERRPIAYQEAMWHIQQYNRAKMDVPNQARGQALSGCLISLSILPANALTGAPLAHVPRMETMPPDSLLLALRAARRAVAAEPWHTAPYALLFGIYQELDRIETQVAGAQTQIRAAQILSALYRSATSRAGFDSQMSHQDLLSWHSNLARNYRTKNYVDLTVSHGRAVLNVIHAMRLEGMPADASAEQREKFEQDLQRLEKNALPFSLEEVEVVLKANQARYRTEIAFRPNPLERAQAALFMGLTEEALVDLQQVDRSQPEGDAAFRMLADLYAGIGNFLELRQLLAEPRAKPALGDFMYHQHGVFAAAALGDYQSALDHLAFVEAGLKEDSIMATIKGVELLTKGGQLESPGSSFQGLNAANQGVNAARQRAEYLYVMGMLALEAGWTDRAAEFFRRAVVEVDAMTVHRSLAVRFYHLITDKWLETAPR